MGYINRSSPKREVLLKEGMTFMGFTLSFDWLTYFGVPTLSPLPPATVADEIERRKMTETHPPDPQGSGGPGGHHWMV